MELDEGRYYNIIQGIDIGIHNNMHIKCYDRTFTRQNIAYGNKGHVILKQTILYK